jgi:hypothetical protein
MSRQIIVSFNLGLDRPSDIHRIRNFGEDVYRHCHGWTSISIADVDRATNQLKVAIRSARRVRRTAQMIEKLLMQHGLSDIARLSEVSQLEWNAAGAHPTGSPRSDVGGRSAFILCDLRFKVSRVSGQDEIVTRVLNLLIGRGAHEMARWVYEDHSVIKGAALHRWTTTKIVRRQGLVP